MVDFEEQDFPYHLQFNFISKRDLGRNALG